MTDMKSDALPESPEVAFELCDQIRTGKKNSRIHGCCREKGHRGVHMNGQSIGWLNSKPYAVSEANPVAEMTDEEAVKAVHPNAECMTEDLEANGLASIIVTTHSRWEREELLAWADARSKLQPVPPNHL